MSMRNGRRLLGVRGALLVAAFLGTCVLMPANLALAQGDLTEAALGTSWFASVKDFEEKTGTTMTFNEAPDLAAQVAAGTLPPLEERLPEDTEVIVPHKEIGVYGGTWHEVTGNARFNEMTQVVLTDAWVQYSRDLKTIRPNLLKEYGFEDDGKTMVLVFRNGVKWSDGAPFTTEDIKYAWERVILNADFQATPGANGFNNRRPVFAFNGDGSPAELEVVDEATVKFHFKEPNYAAQHNLNWWASGYLTFHQPKHYLMQFDPMFNSEMKDYALMAEKSKALENPELPVLWAWRGVSVEPGVRLNMERNPYYWKVDTAGNQLPYVDKMQIDVVQDNEVRLLKLIGGEYDASFRSAPDPENIALFREKGAENGVGVRLWGAHGGYPIYQVNQAFSKDADPYIRTLLQNRDFRCAVSMSLDRAHINDVVLGGMGELGQATLPPDDLVFEGEEGQALFQEWRETCSVYDVEAVAALLDGIQLDKRDGDGFRLRPDGSPLTIVIENFPLNNSKFDADFPTLFKQYLEAVGLRVQWISYNSSQGAVLQDRMAQGVTQITLNDVVDFPFGSTLAFPDYLFPIAGVAPERNWNLIRVYFQTGGAKGEPPEPGSPAEELLKLYDLARAQPTLEGANHYLREAIRIHIKDGPFVAGLGGNTPTVVVVKDNFHNVPDYGIIWGWVPQGPAYTDTEQYFFKQ